MGVGGVGYIYNSTYNLCKVVCTTTTTTTVQRERETTNIITISRTHCL